MDLFITARGCKRYVCLTCGMLGNQDDPDAPKLLNLSEQGDNEPDSLFIERVFKFST